MYVYCMYSLESPLRGDSNECTQHTFTRQKKKISLNYPYIVFGGNPCGLMNVFDSSMVNEPSRFEPLKFCCNMVELQQEIMYLWACVPKEDSDHTAHRYSLISVHWGHLLDNQGSKVSSDSRLIRGLQIR